MNAATSSATPGRATSLISDPDGRFARDYNRRSFKFEHGLGNHPLFTLDALADLARRMPDHRDTYVGFGKTAVGNRWEDGMRSDIAIAKTILEIAHNDSIVILKHTEQDPVYGPVLQAFLQQVVDLAGAQMRDDVLVGETLILVTAPNRITPYHIDAETNFLVQAVGSKTFHVYDSSVVSQQELEEYYTGGPSAARFDPARPATASYELDGGTGVHVPTNSPHWVQNHDGVSVAISVNYELRSVAERVPLYRLNRKLRRLGLAPSPVGRSAVTDRLKTAAARGLFRLRPAAPIASAATYGVWRPR